MRCDSEQELARQRGGLPRLGEPGAERQARLPGWGGCVWRAGSGRGRLGYWRVSRGEERAAVPETGEVETETARGRRGTALRTPLWFRFREEGEEGTTRLLLGPGRAWPPLRVAVAQGLVPEA